MKDDDVDVMLVLERLKGSLDAFFQPEVLDAFLKLREELGDEGGLLMRHKWFCDNGENGSNCRYAKMARHYFLEEHGDNVVLLIKWLFENFASKE